MPGRQDNFSTNAPAGKARRKVIPFRRRPSEPPPAPVIDPDEAGRAVARLFRRRDLIELRVPNSKRGTLSGYFNDPEKLIAALSEADKLQPSGVYVTLNPIRSPELLARSANRLLHFARHTTSDADIGVRRWLPLDFDPVRAAGISSADDQHEAALERARQVREFPRTQGWPDPIYADSGNGAHLLYRIDLRNNPAATDLVRRVLAVLADQFDDVMVKVDRTVFNAARIWKIYGSVARKGSHTAQWPHRQARILEVPASVRVVIRTQLQALATGSLSRTSSHQEPEPREKIPGKLQLLSRAGDDTVRWMLADLRASGIKPASVNALGIMAHSAAQTSKLLGFSIRSESYSIPYRKPDGSPMTYHDATGKVRPFMRFKLRQPILNGKGQTQKYSQPRKSGTHLYFPPLPHCANWAEVVKDPARELIVVEGEKKAVSGMIHLYLPVIGLPGVTSVNEQDLNLIEWRGRKLTVVFDSDGFVKVQVRVAEQRFGRMLADRGAEVYFVHLPHPDYTGAVRLDVNDDGEDGGFA
jgi:hypothetical protein